MSESMKFVAHGAGGAPHVLHLSETAVPNPAAGELLIKVAYAGVNRPDCLQRSGRYPPPPGASPILGLEASGHVVALGEGVTYWKLGDAVCGTRDIVDDADGGMVDDGGAAQARERHPKNLAKAVV